MPQLSPRRKARNSLENRKRHLKYLIKTDAEHRPGITASRVAELHGIEYCLRLLAFCSERDVHMPADWQPQEPQPNYDVWLGNEAEMMLMKKGL